MSRAASLRARAVALRGIARTIEAEADGLDAEASAIDREARSDTELLVAEDARMSAAEWSNAIHKQGLHGRRVGKRLRVKRCDFEAWLETRSVVACPPAADSAPREVAHDGGELDAALARARKRSA